MQFEPSATPAECDAFISRLLEIAGWKRIEKRIDWLDRQQRENPLIEPFLIERYGIEITLARVIQHRRRTGRLPKASDQSAYRLYAFAAMIARVHHRLSKPGRTRLAGMLEDGLKSDYGLGPLAFEMAIASHLFGKGFDVEFSDIESTGRFDLLARRGSLEIEVECKSASGDLGRQIHRRKLYQLSAWVQPILRTAVDSGGGHVFKVILPGRLTGDALSMQSIASGVRTSFESRSPTDSDSFSIRYNVFDFHNTPFATAVDEVSVREFIETQFDADNPNAFFFFKPGLGAAGIIIESTLKDQVLSGLKKQLSRASEQFTTGRPSVLCVRLFDITEQQMLELAKTDEISGLQALTSYLLRKNQREYLHTISYASSGRLLREANMIAADTIRHSLRESGLAWTFINPNNSLADDSRLKIF